MPKVEKIYPMWGCKFLEMEKSVDFQSIKKESLELEVPLSWGLERRKTYIQGHITYLQGQLQRFNRERSETEIEQKLINKHISEALKDLKYWAWQLTKLDPGWGMAGQELNPETISGAKAYPIENLLPFPVKNYVTRCPFHEDKHPSGYTKGNFFFCYGCGKHFDSIGLLMELEGLTFKEAVLNLAGREK